MVQWMFSVVSIFYSDVDLRDVTKMHTTVNILYSFYILYSSWCMSCDGDAYYNEYFRDVNACPVLMMYTTVDVFYGFYILYRCWCMWCHDDVWCKEYFL